MRNHSLNRAIASAVSTGNNVFDAAKKVAGKAAVGAGALVATGSAFAGDLATAVTTEVATGKAEILLIGVALMGLTGVILLITYSRRAAK